MGNKFSAIKRLFNKRGEFGHGIQLRQVSFQRLLHGRNHYLLQPVGLNLLALGVVAQQRRNPVDTYFGSLFEEPLDAFDVFGWGNGNMNTEVSLAVFQLRMNHLYRATLRIRIVNQCMKKTSAPIDKRYLIAFFEPQYPHTMFRFGFVERVNRTFQIRRVKNVHIYSFLGLRNQR